MSTDHDPDAPDPRDDDGSRRLRATGRRGDGAGSAFRDAFSLRGGTDAAPEGDPLEDFDAAGGEEPRTAWPPVIAAVLGVVLALLLAIWSYSAFQRGEQLQGWANRTWAVQGAYTDMTHDLQAQTYNPKYAVTLPDDPEIAEQRFDNGLQDPFTPEAGDTVEVRGEGRGASPEDFDQEVDVLLGIEDGELQVLSTEDAGSLGSGITDRSVSQERTKGTVLAVGSVLALGAGIAAAAALRRRGRR
ncbi:hypothetical protein [Kocuria palustris]|uniref:hypothetical protein n=1 Tax=Kocuria palustris TaxID=71999 RepID=UPI0011A23C3F|nr:hypothetical protein [Kocuria palustris]